MTTILEVMSLYKKNNIDMRLDTAIEGGVVAFLGSRAIREMTASYSWYPCSVPEEEAAERLMMFLEMYIEESKYNV